MKRYDLTFDEHPSGEFVRFSDLPQWKEYPKHRPTDEQCENDVQFLVTDGERVAIGAAYHTFDDDFEHTVRAIYVDQIGWLDSDITHFMELPEAPNE